MDGRAWKSTRGIAVGIVLVLGGCTGATPGGDSTRLESESTALPPVAIDAVNSEPSRPTTTFTSPDTPTATTTVVSATTAAERVLETQAAIPKLAVEELDTESLDQLLSDLDNLLSGLESNLAEEEGELFND